MIPEGLRKWNEEYLATLTRECPYAELVKAQHWSTRGYLPGCVRPAIVSSFCGGGMDVAYPSGWEKVGRNRGFAAMEHPIFLASDGVHGNFSKVMRVDKVLERLGGLLLGQCVIIDCFTEGLEVLLQDALVGVQGSVT